MRILIRRASALSFRQPQKLAYFPGKPVTNTSKLSASYRLIQTMCQGHEEPTAPSAPESVNTSGTATPAESGQATPSTQSEQKSKQKTEWKQKKQQFRKEQTPPATPPPPTHEIIKTGSAKLANGTRYIDVSPPLFAC